MKEKRTGSISDRSSSDWKRLGSIGSREIRAAIDTDPDARPTDPDFWKGAQIVLPSAKKTITIRLDADLLDWFRAQKGYQTRINAVLRTYMDARKASRKHG